jgi:hydrogenase maturation factor
MSRRVLPLGKLPADLLAELLESGPPLPPEVKLGPLPGEDACAIEVPAGVLVAATDPITLTGSGVGAHAVVINANDVAVMGVRPRWFLVAALLPEGSDEEQVRELFASTRAALARIGASLVGGHTEVTAAVRQPVVVGQMLGMSEERGFIRTGGAQVGDVVVQVGPAPIEGGAVLAVEHSARLQHVPAELVERARRALEDPGISVVEPALLCAELGASALHDPTEGGIATGLWELAGASGVALRIDEAALLWFEPATSVCRALGADPLGTLASGTLLATFPPDRAEASLRRLAQAGFQARELGRAEAGRGALLSRGGAFPRFERDEVARLLG